VKWIPLEKRPMRSAPPLARPTRRRCGIPELRGIRGPTEIKERRKPRTAGKGDRVATGLTIEKHRLQTRSGKGRRRISNVQGTLSTDQSTVLTGNAGANANVGIGGCGNPLPTHATENLILAITIAFITTVIIVALRQNVQAPHEQNDVDQAPGTRLRTI
jgi:hypothetical protein